MKKSIVYLLLAVCLFQVFPSKITGQNTDEFLNNVLDRIDKYYMQRPQENIYVHTDRSVYFAGGEILYRVFIRDAANLRPSLKSDKCVLAVMDIRGNEVISLVRDVDEDMMTGSFLLPENLKQGKYNLVGYLTRDDRITAYKVFTKEIILTNPSEDLMMDYRLDRDFYGSTQEFNLELTAYGFKSRRLSKVNVIYDVLIDGETISSGKGKTNKKGTYRIAYRLPESVSDNVIVNVQAKKRRSSQEMVIRIPVAKQVEASPKSAFKPGIGIEIREITDKKLSMGLNYANTQFDDNKKVLIAVLRKGMIYFSAPGELRQASNLNIPISRIPSGVLNVVVFDPIASEVLAETMVYLERGNSPHLELKMDKPSYNNRQRVEAQVSIEGNVINIPEETSFSVSVVPRDLLPENDLLLNDHLMINADIIEDGTEALADASKSPDRRQIIEDLLFSSTRNGYNWESVLEQEVHTEELAEDEIREIVEKRSYFPRYFNASRMKDFSRDIEDDRHSNGQVPAYKRQLESGMSVLEAVKTIKPYTRSGNKIIFPGKHNSLYAQQGALIVIDGHAMGQNATVLNSINPTDVESIVVSTQPGDIQRYTGMNSVGLIEVNLKGNTTGSLIEEKDSRDELVKGAQGHYLSGYPNYALESDSRSVKIDFRKTLFWEPEMKPAEDGKVTFEFYTSDLSGMYVITIQGMVGSHPVAIREEFEVR